jgi:hypothetical protein
VLFGRCALPLVPLWKDDPIVLVPSIDAIRLRREEGCQDLTTREALWHFDAMDRLARSRIRQFVAEARLTRIALPSLKDLDLIALVRQSIQDGRLVAMRKGGDGGQSTDGTAEQRRLVRAIEKQTSGRLSFSGRQYKLVADVDLASVPSRDSYEVVRQDDARRVLDGLTKQSGAAGELAGLLGQASAKLTPDWRPPFTKPDGLILLRRSVVLAATRTDDSPAITPSQLRALMEKAALEIHVVDLNQKPQEGLAFKIAMPDGGSASGKLDKEGRGRAKSASPGVFTVTFPELDGEDWGGDGALDLPEEKRSEASRYKVEQADRLPTIARKKGFSRWQTIWDFAGNAALKELRGNAHILFPGDEVSIPSKLARVAEVQGGKAEYVVLSAPEVLRVRFAEFESMDGEPAMFRATPDAGNDLFEGELADDGTLEIELPPDATQVTVELFCGDGDDPFVTYELDVGGIDPLTEITGIQARLANLGHYDGVIDGDAGEVTKGAIVRFRREYGLPLSDEIDDDLRNALEWVHDDGDDTDDCEADRITPDDPAAGQDMDGGSDSEGSNEPSDDAENTAADDEESDDDSADEESADTDDEDPVEWEDDAWEAEDDGGETGDASQEEPADGSAGDGGESEKVTP